MNTSKILSGIRALLFIIALAFATIAIATAVHAQNAGQYGPHAPAGKGGGLADSTYFARLNAPNTFTTLSTNEFKAPVTLDTGFVFKPRSGLTLSTYFYNDSSILGVHSSPIAHPYYGGAMELGSIYYPYGAGALGGASFDIIRGFGGAFNVTTLDTAASLEQIGLTVYPTNYPEGSAVENYQRIVIDPVGNLIILDSSTGSNDPVNPARFLIWQTNDNGLTITKTQTLGVDYANSYFLMNSGAAGGLSLATGEAYAINETSVLNSHALGAGITSAPSLDTVNTLTSGATGAGFTLNFGTSTLSGTILGANGGTGVANTGKTITLGGNLTTSGAYASTFSMTGAYTYTMPAFTSTVAALGATTVFVTQSTAVSTNSTAAFVMMGLDTTTNVSANFVITPLHYGTIEVTIDGSVIQNTTADSAFYKVAYAAVTTNVPKNGDAATGTVVGTTTTIQGLTGMLLDGFPFTKHVIITGLSAGTKYWIDLQAECGTGGRVTFRNCTLTAKELQY